nr:immunoglobulin heavy chain junction region [Macaca mulatta]MOX15222.1 immunoglobulin heavy chain junction region [Macaca mulatta]MOX15602.1 immunoglobulin heavy chain junction region [Macaca mulatta]MOX15925.1 immunoglobulin heavy chain junction region [Macaca mulatta]MOX16053.1 immunoglobulin heavy chain junction region [Macaca mulatta]
CARDRSILQYLDRILPYGLDSW